MKERLDILLVDLRLVESRTKAQWLIENGHVLVNGKEIRKKGKRIDNASKIADKMYDAFNEDILIVMSKRTVSNKEPVGESNDKCWIDVGRYFDDLAREYKKGIFIYY